jgi:hypothetical protein
MANQSAANTWHYSIEASRGFYLVINLTTKEVQSAWPDVFTARAVAADLERLWRAAVH